MSRKSPIRLLILLQRPEGWLNVRGLWAAASKDDRFDPALWVLPYNVLRPEGNANRLEEWRALLVREGAPFAVFGHEDLPELDTFDAAVFTVPYDRERPGALHFDNVARRVPVTVYLPYGLTMGGGRQNRRLQYGQPAQARSTLVCARSSREKALYRMHCPTGDGHVSVVGHPRFDALSDIEDFRIDPDLVAAIDGRVPVLWNSHFSFGPDARGLWDYSTFDRIGGGLLEFGMNNPDFALIWRPHPHLFPTLSRLGVLAEADVDPLRRELSAGGVILDRRDDYRHAFAASRALVTDLGSFLMEYLMVERPILYTHNPDGPGLNEEGQELVAHLEVAESVDEVLGFVRRQAAEPDAAERARLGFLRRRFLPLQDGQSGNRILQAVEDALGGVHPTGKPESVGESPATRRLILELARLDDQRSGQSPLRRGITVWARRVRQALAEAVKRRPRLLRLFGKLSGQPRA